MVFNLNNAIANTFIMENFKSMKGRQFVVDIFIIHTIDKRHEKMRNSIGDIVLEIF